MQPPSSRAFEKVTIQCGLVSIPVEVYNGMDKKADKIKRKTFTGENGDHEAGYAWKDKVTGEVDIPRDQLVKKVETAQGYVFVEDGEIESLLNIAPKTVAIKSFHPMTQWVNRDLVGDGLYYVEPTRISRKVSGKTVKTADAASNMALNLLLESMRQENVFALVEWVSRGTPKPAVLLPSGQLWTVLYDDQLREQRPFETPELPEAHIEQLRSLITAMQADELPELKDTYSAAIQQFADDKAAAGDFTKPAEVTVSGDVVTGVDFMEQLAASVEAAKQQKAS